jgi:aminopeptidase-like protein
MKPLEQLALDGALNLLTYLQFTSLEDDRLGAIAVTATLCEMLSQLETRYPGITDSYGWQKVGQSSGHATWQRCSRDCPPHS